VKTCACCKQTKPVTEFYQYRNGSPMHLCKVCHRHKMKVRRLTNPYVQEYDRMRAKTPGRREHVQVVAADWRKQHPDAYRAQTAVSNAIRDGKLIKLPCEICGTTKNVHAHHKDYSRPFEVAWLCALHHHRLHAIFPGLGGNYTL
jgi:hypothetical protein